MKKNLISMKKKSNFKEKSLISTKKSLISMKKSLISTKNLDQPHQFEIL